jgi:glycosyltransferase involved in cell wall biosynthesis
MSEKKNLLLLCPMLHQGGFERVCVTTARLMQEFYNVYIVIFSSKDINYDVTGLNVIDINVPSEKGLVKKVVNVFKRANKIKKVKKDLKCDIAYSFGSANYSNVLSGGPGKVLTGLRCQTDMESPRQIRLFGKKSDQVLSCSKEILRQLKSDYNYDKSTYIYNPLDVNEIQTKGAQPVTDAPFAAEKEKDSDIIIISNMGRNDYIKGNWHLVKAFNIVQKKYPKARLQIFGSGDWSAYKKMAEEMGIADKAAFPGLRKNPFAYVSGSDIYVCSSNHEGFPNAVLEALALNKPVISADCKTGPREILLSDEQYQDLISKKPDGSSVTEPVLGEYGILVPDLGEQVDMDVTHVTPEEEILAEQILRLIEDKELADRYSRKASERALFYTPEKYQTAIHNILREYE